MKERRIEIRLTPADALWSVLAELPGRQRNAVARAILEAALLPGGWVKLAAHPIAGRFVEVIEAETAHFEKDPPVTDDAPLVGGMSPGGARGFLAGLRQFGALEDH